MWGGGVVHIKSGSRGGEETGGEEGCRKKDREDSVSLGVAHGGFGLGEILVAQRGMG